MRLLTRATLIPLLFAALLCAGCATEAASSGATEEGLVVIAGGAPERPHFHDFGAVPYGERAHHVFVMRNTDSKPLTVLSAQGACACSAVSQLTYETETGEVVRGDVRAKEGILTIPPGGVANVTVTVDTTLVPNPNKDKLAVVRMRTDSLGSPFITFELHVIAQKLFQVTPATLHLGEVPTTHGGSALARIITGVPDSPARIVAIAEQGETVVASLDETFSSGEHIWTLTVDLPALHPLGTVRDKVVLETTDAEGEGEDQRLTIDVWAQVVDDVVLYPRRASFGALPRGEAARVRLELKALVPGARLAVLEATIESPVAEHFSVEFAPVAPDADGRSPVWRVALESDAELPVGSFQGTLSLALDDTQTPVARSAFAGVVRPSQ